MNPIDIAFADLIGIMVGFILTLFVFSYIGGDNIAYRLATHIFVGVAAGYAVVVTFSNIILPNLIFPLFSEYQEFKLLTLFYLLISVLLITKISPRLSKMGNVSMAILVGIGAAVAISGAVFGTISPQVSASINVFETNDALTAGLILIGTIVTLIYFQFGIQKKNNKTSELSQVIKWIGYVGQFFIAVTFGTIFAGVYFSALAALIERLSFIWQFITENFLPSIFS